MRLWVMVCVVTVSPASRAQDDVEIRLEDFTRLGRRRADHRESVGSGRPDAEHDASARHVVELHHAIGGQSGLWYAIEVTPVPSFDLAGARGGRGDEDLRRSDQLGTGRVMLAEPGPSSYPESVQVLDELRSCSKASVGLMPGLCTGAMNVPNLKCARGLSFDLV